MSRDFSQIYVSKTLTHFKVNIKKKWNLVDYHNKDIPSIFFGVYREQDLKIILNHQSYGIIIFGGNDLHKDQVLKIFEYKKDTFFTFGYGWMLDFFKKLNIPHKYMVLPIKKMETLKPTPLGKNIYIYIGWSNIKRYKYFKFDEIILPLIDNFGENRVIWVKENNSINFASLVKDYYNNSFVFVKTNQRGGSTTMWELALMGRKTIAQNQGGAPNVLEYKNLDHMIDLIYEESKKIGTVQECVYNSTKKIFQESDEWLYLKFWL